MSRPDRLYLSPPHMSGTELDYVRRAFDSNWIAPIGEHVDGFEQEIAAYAGVESAAVLTSGTAAIHLGLKLLGVGPGDLVAVPSFTFAASVNPIRYMGAEPVLIDSEPESWSMDPYLLREAAAQLMAEGRKPSAIVAVHLYGMPARMDPILKIAEEFEIPVLEDAAEAVGSTYGGRPCGGLGTLGVYSFNGNKIITTSGGGALLGNNPEQIARARFLASQARDPAPHYQHSELGYNYRMSNLLAGVGRGQLAVLKDRVESRRAIYRAYKEDLEGSGIEFLPEPEGSLSNRWLTTVVVDPARTGGADRERIRLALEQENIESRPLWKPMHIQPLYRDVRFYENGLCEALFEKGLCLPSGSSMSSRDRERVVSVIWDLIDP